LAVRGGFFRFAGLAVVIAAFVYLLNVNPFRTRPYEPYHGDEGIAPFQLLIDDVTTRGGLIFWGYVEVKPGTDTMGAIRVRREAYPQVLKESSGSTGFIALGPEPVTLTDPGGLWDRVLLEHCKGLRKEPVWGIAAAGFQKEIEGAETLGSIQTVFWLKEKSKKGVLKALRNGKMYACRGTYPAMARLDEFSVSSMTGDNKAVSGDEISLKGTALIRIALSSAEQPGKTVKVRLIRSGKPIKSINAALPLAAEYKDSSQEIGKKVYYRLEMTGRGSLISNPIFVTREKD